MDRAARRADARPAQDHECSAAALHDDVVSREAVGAATRRAAFAQSPKSSPTGFNSSMWSQTALMTISIGTASSIPHTFHTQPQNSSPMKIATAFICEARLVSQGVSRNPSALVITSDTSEMTAAMGNGANCRNAITAVPPVTMTGPKYGIELNNPASSP